MAMVVVWQPGWGRVLSDCSGIVGCIICGRLISLLRFWVGKFLWLVLVKECWVECLGRVSWLDIGNHTEVVWFYGCKEFIAIITTVICGLRTFFAPNLVRRYWISKGLFGLKEFDNQPVIFVIISAERGLRWHISNCWMSWDLVAHLPFGVNWQVFLVRQWLDWWLWVVWKW